MKLRLNTGYLIKPFVGPDAGAWIAAEYVGKRYGVGDHKGKVWYAFYTSPFAAILTPRPASPRFGGVFTFLSTRKRLSKEIRKYPKSHLMLTSEVLAWVKNPKSAVLPNEATKTLVKRGWWTRGANGKYRD